MVGRVRVPALFAEGLTISSKFGRCSSGKRIQRAAVTGADAFKILLGSTFLGAVHPDKP